MDDYLSLSEQIKILFDSVRHSEGRSFTLQEVSDATGISLATISQMRSGRIKNPQLNTIRPLCRFFGVPLRYFDTRTAEECFAILTDVTAKDAPPELNEIAFRASGLSPRSQRDVLEIIKWVQASEKGTLEGDNPPPFPNFEDDEDTSANE